LSNSRIVDFASYGRTRLVSRRLLALWLSLIVASLLASAVLPAMPELAAEVVFLLLAIVVFRLWDDLADLDHDRLHHADRTLLATSSLRSFIVAVPAGLVLLSLMLREHIPRLLLFLIFVACLALLYHSAPGRRVVRPLRAGLVLAKYPLFLFLLATLSLRACVTGLVLFTILWIYEWRSDPDLRNAPGAQLVTSAASGAAVVAAQYFLAGALS